MENLQQMITDSKKRTPVKLYINYIDEIDFNACQVFGSNASVYQSKIVFGEYKIIKVLLNKHQAQILDYKLEYDCLNSAMPLLNILDLDIRVEPGAIIRSGVKIGKHAIILMGAIINIGVSIGENTMIDMGAIIGSGVRIGCNTHISAGAVIAGMIEPICERGVIIGDNVLVGANAVILEGIKIGDGSVIGAGAVVTKDVLENSVVIGIPAKHLKFKDEQTIKHTQIVKKLRNV